MRVLLAYSPRFTALTLDRSVVLLQRTSSVSEFNVINNFLTKRLKVLTPLTTIRIPMMWPYLEARPPSSVQVNNVQRLRWVHVNLGVVC